MQKTGQACTALAFSLRRTTEFLVALVDNTIKCFDKGRMETSTHLGLLIISWMYSVFSHRFIFNEFSLGIFSLRHKAVGQLDARSRGSSFIHLCPQLWSLRHQHIIGHGSALGSGHLPEEEEAQHQTVCWHSEGKYTDLANENIYKW